MDDKDLILNEENYKKLATKIADENNCALQVRNVVYLALLDCYDTEKQSIPALIRRDIADFAENRIHRMFTDRTRIKNQST